MNPYPRDPPPCSANYSADHSSFGRLPAPILPGPNRRPRRAHGIISSGSGCPARRRVGLRLRFRLCARRALRAARRGWQKRCGKGGGEPVLVCGLGPASADDEVEVVARADVSGPGSEGRDGSCSERSGGCGDDEHLDGGPAPGWLVASGWCAGHQPTVRPGEGDQEGVVVAGAVDACRADGPEARLAEPGAAQQSWSPPAHVVALLVPAGQPVTVASCPRPVPGGGDGPAQKAISCRPWPGSPPMPRSPRPPSRARGTAPSVSSPTALGILRRQTVRPRPSAPDDHGMILIERRVDLEDTTYRVI